MKFLFLFPDIIVNFLCLPQILISKDALKCSPTGASFQSHHINLTPVYRNNFNEKNNIRLASSAL